MVDTDTSASLNTSRNEGEDIAVNLQFIVEESNSSCWQERGANKEGEEAGRSAFSIGDVTLPAPPVMMLKRLQLLASLVEDPVEVEQDEADEYDGYDFEVRRRAEQCRAEEKS